MDLSGCTTVGNTWDDVSTHLNNTYNKGLVILYSYSLNAEILYLTSLNDRFNIVLVNILKPR